jgi:hypothetical protein
VLFSTLVTVSSFTNCGLIPTNESMAVFAANRGLLLCQHLYYYPGPGDGSHVWQPKEQARAEAQCPCERPRVASVMPVYERACARRRADNVVTSYTHLITSSSSSCFLSFCFPQLCFSTLFSYISWMC